jgi:carbon monoxide dehydrogenase subunit G
LPGDLGRFTVFDMLKMTGSVCIDAPVGAVWAVLSDLDAIHVWVDSIRRSHCPAQDRGVGAVRLCELEQGTIRETIVEWQEGRSFTYHGEGAPMMKHASNRWTVEPHGAQTLVTTTAEVVLKGGFFGVLLEPLVKIVARRMGARSLASLKYLVENGHPYRGNPRRLAPAPTGC